MTTYPKWPSDLVKKNQAVLAERMPWPDGARDACLTLMEQHPCWHVSWAGENTAPGFESPAGFYADYRHPDGGRHKLKVFAATAKKLEPLLAEVPEHDYSTNGCAWCRSRL